jgi:uncharacterized protein YdhG (YjbR/CyaY superfamily)
MQSAAKTIDQYVAELPEERQLVINKLRAIFKQSLPNGFEEQMSYGMLGFVVPFSIYPKGYYCNPSLPLPFIGLASQKNFISIYHMGLYADESLLNWFITEFQKTGFKLDMGKSCIRFKNLEKIPFDLIDQLAKKITVNDWISKIELISKK